MLDIHRKARTSLFIRLLNHFHSHPISQDDFKLGVGTSCLRYFLEWEGNEAVDTFDKIVSALSVRRSPYYTKCHYNLLYCLNCKSTETTTIHVHSPFSTSCYKCMPLQSQDNKHVIESQVTIEDTKYYNPMVTIFPDLNVALQDAILQELLTRG